MEINVFGKKKFSKEGREFTVFSTKLPKKDGTEIFANVKFRKEVGEPKTTPCTLILNKADCNLVTKNGVTDEGKEYTNHTLWVSAYEECEYVDNSLDEIDFD